MQVDIHMKMGLVFQSPLADSKREVANQANTVYVGETLNKFLHYTPRDLASKLGRYVFVWSAAISEQKSNQASPSSEEMLKVLKKETIDFLREAHPYYSGIKEPEDTDFILRFITGILVFYKYNCAPKMVFSIFTKDLITYLIGSQYGQTFEDYERAFSTSIDTSKKSSLDSELGSAFTTDGLLSFVNIHSLLSPVLRGTMFDLRGADGKEVFLSHLMAWHVIYYMEKKDIYPDPLRKNEVGFQKYSGFFRDFSDYYMGLRKGRFLPDMGGICYFHSIQAAVLTELEYIAAGSFKIKQCAGCNLNRYRASRNGLRTAKGLPKANCTSIIVPPNCSSRTKQ